ncbi:MAG TPA: tetratricopeptide repeat protein [Leptolyngbyaceae cyanobacterium M33_DOE_097]|nr:tetratricopeptide repeat protein [Leptolyngbyaceae cyanobacterium M33_DOE_097]
MAQSGGVSSLGLIAAIAAFGVLGLAPVTQAQGASIDRQLRNPLGVTAIQRRDEADRLLQEGRQLEAQGQLLAAIAVWRKALDNYQVLGEVSSQGIVYTYLGSAYFDLGYLRESEDAYRRRLAIARDRGDLQAQIYALNGVGRVLLQRQAYQSAKPLFTEALQIAEVIKNYHGEAQSRDSLGLLAFTLRDYGQAQVQYELALKAGRRAADPVMEATTLNLLGDLYEAQDQYREAINYYGLALRIARLNRDRTNQLKAIEGSVPIFVLQNNYLQAIDLLNEQLEVAQFRENSQLELETLQQLAETYWLAKNYPEAEKNYEAAIALAQTLQDGSKEARLKLQLMNMKTERR